jgi:hypothetical protein
MHVSVRVPWHDHQWNGTVCTNPKGNTSCLVLPRIAEKKDDDFEAHPQVCGKEWDQEGGTLPACAAERGAFMAPFSYYRRVNHPYSHNALYAHFRRTTFSHPAYSLAAVPFAWMMKEKDGIPANATAYGIRFDQSIEPPLDFDKTWVQERKNQLRTLDTFFGALTKNESLVFCYAKQTPLTDDRRRVIVGIGRVLSVDPHVEYEYEKGTPPAALRCVLWERNIHHSIRPDDKDGFLLPFHELLVLAEKDSNINVAEYVLHAPAEHFDAFSMGAEHVTHDQAISVLTTYASMIDRWQKILPGHNWPGIRSWIDSELNRLWRLRGAFPGLGSALSALGVADGTLVAHAIGQQLHSDGKDDVRDPWPLVEQVFKNPKLLPPDLSPAVGPTVALLWQGLPQERRALLKLLSRFAISASQATRWFVTEERQRAKIGPHDEEILKNPYRMFEEDRYQLDPIALATIDRGLFPDTTVRAALPVPAPSCCTEAIDYRRGRALCISALVQAAGEGHTLLPQDWLVQRVRDTTISPPCGIGSDWITAFTAILDEQLDKVTLPNGSTAWQLHEYASTRELIGTRVNRRLTAKRLPGEYDWRSCVDAELPPLSATVDQQTEEFARQEKAKSLDELYHSRFSVLIGPAGTGKTSLLTALIGIPSVAEGGVLLLAPTGKARVQMQRRAKKAKAQTLAQFLLGYGRYNPRTFKYSVTSAPKREKGSKTVIIDECSMLTEEQLAATLDAIEAAAVDRLILVGDPRQLPPIGAGRPFVDIVRHVRTAPTVPRGHAELRIIRRQTDINGSESTGDPAATRDDIILASWFGGEAHDPGADEVWDRLANGTARGVHAIAWEGDADLQVKLITHLKAALRQITKETCAKDTSDNDVFEISLGGQAFGGAVYFHPSRVRNGELTKGAGASAEAWQILSPVRPGETGVDGINRFIQRLFRERARHWAQPDKPWDRKTFKPLGRQDILYGDKVINVANGSRDDVFPEKDSAYLANGEIGMVVGQYKGKDWKPKTLPWKAEVEFSSQLAFKYGFQESDFGEERDASLELAYALTIHKAQGSEFGVTFVIIPNPCRLLSRELLYTALTRQQHSVFLFHQGDVRALKNLTTAEYSETARRMTNLFSAPAPVLHNRTFLEEGMIHRTARGELVRSKSEVIIATILDKLGVPYGYEEALRANDGSTRYPDFTIDDAETGQRIILEHLGMLDEPAYQRRWEAKRAWYHKHGIREGPEGGENGTLFTTDERTGIDCEKIEQRLRELLNL